MSVGSCGTRPSRHSRGDRHRCERGLARLVQGASARHRLSLRRPLPDRDLPTASINIIYAHSVFTHIPLEHQVVWLRELERLLRPGGWLAITFLGRAQQEALLNEQQQGTLRTKGEVQVYPDTLPGHEGSVGSAPCARPSRVRRRWSAGCSTSLAARSVTAIRMSSSRRRAIDERVLSEGDRSE